MLNAGNENEIVKMEFSYSDLVAFCMGKWMLVLGAVAVSVVIALVSTFFLTERYKSTAILSFNSDVQKMKTDSMSEGFGGLASLAGINIGANGSFAEEVLAMARSRKFVIDFIEKNNVKKVIFSDLWDEENKSWEGSVWGALSGKQPQEPSDEIAFRTFSKENYSIAQDRKTGLVVLAIRAPSSEDAVSWARKIIEKINLTYKDREIAAARMSLEFLDDELKRNSSLEMKNVLYDLIKDQKQRMMLAQISQDYVFKSVDPPFTPEYRDFPRRSGFVVVGAFAGLVLSVGFLVVSYFLAQGKKEKSKRDSD